MKHRIFAILLLVMLLTGCAASVPVQTETVLPTVVTTPETTQPPTETTAPPETTEPPVVESARATISVTGDVMMHMPLIRIGNTGSGYDYNSFFDYIYAYVNDADFAVANLETTLAGTANEDAYSGYPRFNCPDAIVDALKNAGFDMLLTANNHSYDTGAYGMERTQQVIADGGLLHLGTVPSGEDPKYLVQDLNGIKVGMVCYTYGQISSENGQKAVNGLPIKQELTKNINVFDYNKLDLFYSEMETILADMEAEVAEATVLFIHWGEEYQLTQNSYQETIAQKMCDLGVDVIVGGHPHVIQPVSMLTSSEDPAHRTFCVYSTGNALSNQRAGYMRLNTGHTEDGMLVSFTFVKYSNGIVALDTAEILPTWLYAHNGYFEILPLDKNLSDWKSAFDIGEGNYNLACASYDRTMALVGPGMEEVTAALKESRKLRELEYDVAYG